MALAETGSVASQRDRRTIGKFSIILRRILTIGLVAIGLVVAWAGMFRENYHVVAEGVLYRAGQPSAARLQEYVEQDGIRTVVNLRGTWEEESWYRREKEAAARLGVEVHDVEFVTFKLAPMAQLRRYLEILDTSPKPILIHCRHGADRTSLAAAVYRLAVEGTSIEAAKQEFSLFYGHTGLAHGWRLPHLFDFYQDWLLSEGRVHSKEAFRDWIRTEPAVGYFAARIEPINMPEALGADRATRLEFRVTNISRYPWPINDDPDEGVHFQVRAYWFPDGEKTTVSAPLLTQGDVPPGATVTASVTLPPLKRTGDIEVLADLVDGNELKFVIMGIGGWRRMVPVR